mgnify:CR=1 FL=1
MGSVFSGPKIQPTPAPPDPVRIPSPTDPDVAAAAKMKTQDEFAKRKGRDSTRLATGDTAYTRTTLGS